MRPLQIDSEGDLLAWSGVRAWVETRNERTTELHLTLACLLGLDPVDAEVDQGLRAELLGELHRAGEVIAAGLACRDTGIEEMLGPQAEQDLALASV